MCGSIAHRLPVELLYFIFEPLRLNKSTLSSCSLVSHAWLDPARFYLFKLLRYTVDGVFEPEDDVDNHHDPCATLPLKDLLQFLDSTPAIRSHIRVLEIAMRTLYFTNRRYRGGRLDDLYAILCNTPNLETLIVCGFAFQPPDSSLEKLAPTKAPALIHLENLCISHYQSANLIQGPNYALYIMGLVGTIGNIDIDIDIDTYTPPDVGAFQANTPWRDRELSVSDFGLAQYFQSISGFDDLESIDIAMSDAASFIWLSNYLKTTGRGLRKLGFSFPGHESTIRRYGVYPIDAIRALIQQLPALSALSSLSVSLPAMVIYPPYALCGVNLYFHVYDALVNIISSLPSCLRTIRFWFHYQDVWGYDASYNRHYSAVNLQNDWSTLDTAIEDRTVNHRLENVVITDGGSGEGLSEVEKEILIGFLPRVHARGVLQFEYGAHLWDPYR